MTVKSIIAKSIMELRQGHKLTQTEFGDKLGVKTTTVSNWENEINSVDIETLLKICDIFDVPLKAVLGPYANVDFTELEIKEVVAYRNHKNMHEAINKLLDI